jgi:oxygen-independent coproporphyrinogen-3 oxidase
MEPSDGRERLTTQDVNAELVYLGLRTTDGLTLTKPELDVVPRWITSGWAELKGADRLLLTANGWLRLDSLATALTAVRSRSYI